MTKRSIKASHKAIREAAESAQQNSQKGWHIYSIYSWKLGWKRASLVAAESLPVLKRQFADAGVNPTKFLILRTIRATKIVVIQ